MLKPERIELKSPSQVRLMRRAGLVVADALDAVRAAAVPGVSTAELDAVAVEVIAAAGARASFLGYQGFPRTICASVNDEIVHGIPGSRELAAGDVLSIDCGAVVDGWHGDAAFTMIVPPGPGESVAGQETAAPDDIALVEAARSALWAGMAALRPGGRLGAVGEAIDDHVELGHDGRWGLVEEYTGHGIGTQMHLEPAVLNYRVRGRTPRVRPGLVVAVEPMLTAGAPACHVLADDWTVVTTDGSRAAHWEHTVAVLADGLWVLTARDGGVTALAVLGAPVSAMATGADRPG